MSTISKIISPIILDNYVNFWLSEDLPYFDLSTLVTEDENIFTANIDLKENAVLAGFPFCEAVAKKFSCIIDWNYKEGEYVKSPSVVGTVRGLAHNLLMAERTILNILCRASGIATVASKIKDSISNKWKGEITGNRKTTPGFRMVEKYAMYVGGIGTHRYNLSSMALVKDNHIKAAGGSVEESIKNLKSKIRNNFTKIEVEVSSLEDGIKAAKNGADIIMLDNMKPKDIINVSKQIKNINKSVLIEASGGINEFNIKDYAIDNVDIISSSLFCQGYKSIDFSINFVTTKNISSPVVDLTSDNVNQTTNGAEVDVSVSSKSTPTSTPNTAKNLFTKPKPDLKRKVEDSPEMKKTTNESPANVDKKQNETAITPIQYGKQQKLNESPKQVQRQPFYQKQQEQQKLQQKQELQKKQEIERQQESERQQELKKQQDIEKQKELEMQRELERQKELERQQELKRQQEIEKQQELEKQEFERQKELERKEKERQQELQKQKEQKSQGQNYQQQRNINRNNFNRRDQSQSGPRNNFNNNQGGFRSNQPNSFRQQNNNNNNNNNNNPQRSQQTGSFQHNYSQQLGKPLGQRLGTPQQSSGSGGMARSGNLTFPGSHSSQLTSQVKVANISPIRYGGTSVQSTLNLSAAALLANAVKTSSPAAFMRPNNDKYVCRKCRYQNQIGGPPYCQKCQSSLL